MSSPRSLTSPSASGARVARTRAATLLDRERVRAFVRGYESVRPLTNEERAVLPTLLRGRGLQMLIERTQRRVADVGPIDEVRWLEDHHADLVHLLTPT